MHAHQRVTNLPAGVSFFQKIRQRIKIAERFGHLLSVDQQMRAMQPVAHEFFPSDAFALRDLRLVMRENVIHSTAVDVDLIAE